MIATIDNGIDRAVRAIGAPFRWLRLRGRRRAALALLDHARRAYGPKAELTVWDGRTRGGVGVLSVERGSIQVYATGDDYTIQWYGDREHPVSFDEVRTSDDVTLEAMVRKWSARWYVHDRRPSAGPHHMEI